MKSILTLVFVLSISLSIHSQVDRTNLRIGLNAGTIVGDAADFYSFTLGVDVLHVWGLSREIDLGFATGFTNAFGEEDTLDTGGAVIETQFDNAQFIPVAGALRIYPSFGFKLGGDIGYAIGVNEGNDGGFYYRPIIGVDVNGTTELNISYTTVENEGAFSSVLLGVLFLF
ncbi:hypothetical protein [Croceitalea rosinachiae]|uniref:Outer membrane protein beta-barrel domain-containing protein n=1 Tax=Croceitalea rosinachiae TaxID=3075596 RepID=A0ABU3AED5_9FLAO|nr:hypothetical protein [Croceitalea sp. F388]MDT0608539.1 hypothetical protein [Croceitalea sp. F388]